jgi:UDP-N-acetylmuramate dehydrogenase
VPLDFVGWGANILFTDGKYQTKLINTRSISFIEVNPDLKLFPLSKIDFADRKISARHIVSKDKNRTSGYVTDDLNYDEFEAEDVYLLTSPGVSLPFLINDSISKGITGLQLFAGIPGTVGGAVFNNIHGGSRLLSEFIEAVECIDNDGNLFWLTWEELLFNYNESKLKQEQLVVTKVLFHLKLGDKERAKSVSIEWARRKSLQPKNSLGSVFHNIDEQTKDKLGMPTTSTAYLIEHKLNLSGYRVGDIKIPDRTDPSQPQINKNIFMNLGNGTAEEYIAVMRKVWEEANSRFGIKLKSEIYFKGISDDLVRDFK